MRSTAWRLLKAYRADKLPFLLACRAAQVVVLIGICRAAQVFYNRLPFYIKLQKKNAPAIHTGLYAASSGSQHSARLRFLGASSALPAANRGGTGVRIGD